MSRKTELTELHKHGKAPSVKSEKLGKSKDSQKWLQSGGSTSKGKQRSGKKYQ